MAERRGKKRARRRGKLELVAESDRPAPSIDWVESLEPGFRRGNTRFHGAPDPTLGTCLAAGFDHVATGASLVYGIPVVPQLWWRGIDGFLDKLSFYTDDALWQDPDSFFQAPPKKVAIEERRRPARFFEPGAGVRHRIRFESPFETVNPSARSRYAAYETNRTVDCRAWFHADRPRPVMICIHGFGLPDFAVNTELFWARELFTLGLDVVLFTLPFHGARSEPDQWFHGQNFVSLSLWRLNEAVAQAVMDLRILMRHLRGRGHPMVGVTGYSLGGYHTALLAGLEPSLDFAIPAAPVLTLSDLMFEWPIGWLLRIAFWNRPDALARFRRTMAVHTPLTHPLRIPRERAFLVGALGDRMAPPSHTHLLWEHWDHPRVHWTTGGHLLLLDRSPMFRDLVAFFEDVGALDAEGRALAS